MLSIVRNLTLCITFLLLLINSFGTVVARKNSSLIALLEDTDTDHPKSGISLVQHLTSKSTVMLKPFEKLIAKLGGLDKTACEIDCEFLFVTAFRAMEGGYVNGAHNTKVLNDIRALYSIRKAVCETRSTIVEIPPSCAKLLPTDQTAAGSRQRMVEAELKLASSTMTQDCLRKIREHHHLWTSYSNNLQEANDFIHLLRSDIELQSMVMTYRDFEASINNLDDELHKLRARNFVWFKEAELKSKTLFDAQHRAFVHFEQGLRNTTELAYLKLDEIFRHLDDHHIKLRESSSSANDRLTRVLEDISSASTGIAGMQRGVSQLYSGAAMELTNLVRSQKTGLEHTLTSIDDKLSPVVQHLNNLDHLSSDLIIQLQRSHDLHAVNAEQLQKQSGLSAAMFAQLRGSFELINSTHEVLGRVSAQAQNFNTIVNNLDYLLAFVKYFEQMLKVAVVYVALTLLLTPFEWFLIPSHVAKKIKLFCCVLSVTNVMLEWLLLDAQIEELQSIISRLLAGTIWFVGFSGVGFLLLYILRSQEESVDRYDFDVEHARHSTWTRPALEPQCYDICETYKSPPPRYTRFSSTPPGL